jgi:hypothetical protein
MSSITEKIRLAYLFLVISQTINRWGNVLAWLQGQTFMQMQQSVPALAQ